MALIQQEVTQERYVEIPEEVQEIYKIWRPTPLFRASRLEKMLDTPAKMYYKYEGVSPAGSHKPNTAVPDLGAYEEYASGKLKGHELTDAEVKAYLKELEGYPTAV